MTCCKGDAYCAYCDPGIEAYWQEKCKSLRDAGYDPECFLEAKEVWWEYNKKIASGEIKREDYLPKSIK